MGDARGLEALEHLARSRGASVADLIRDAARAQYLDVADRGRRAHAAEIFLSLPERLCPISAFRSSSSGSVVVRLFLDANVSPRRCTCWSLATRTSKQFLTSSASSLNEPWRSVAESTHGAPSAISRARGGGRAWRCELVSGARRQLRAPWGERSPQCRRTGGKRHISCARRSPELKRGVPGSSLARRCTRFHTRRAPSGLR